MPNFFGSWPSRLKIATEWPRADEGGLAEIEQWIRSAPAPRLIIIDTLAQFRRRSNGKTPIAVDQLLFKMVKDGEIEALTDGATLIGLRPDVYDALVPAHGQLAPRHSRRSD